MKNCGISCLEYVFNKNITYQLIDDKGLSLFEIKNICLENNRECLVTKLTYHELKEVKGFVICHLKFLFFKHYVVYHDHRIYDPNFGVFDKVPLYFKLSFSNYVVIIK